jgi:hypothetical protein
MIQLQGILTILFAAYIIYLRYMTSSQEALIDEQQELIQKLIDREQEYKDALGIKN